jgi:hypothetical protein
MKHVHPLEFCILVAINEASLKAMHRDHFAEWFKEQGIVFPPKEVFCIHLHRLVQLKKLQQKGQWYALSHAEFE